MILLISIQMTWAADRSVLHTAAAHDYKSLHHKSITKIVIYYL